MKPARICSCDSACGGASRRHACRHLKASHGRGAAAASPRPTDGVLAAANELFRGDVLTEANMRWDEWPAEKIPAGVIRKSTSPGAIVELKGAKLRAGCAAGEPLRRERIALGQHSGFIASDLPPGKRAVAINIDAQGSSTLAGLSCPLTPST